MTNWRGSVSICEIGRPNIKYSREIFSSVDGQNDKRIIIILLVL